MQGPRLPCHATLRRAVYPRDLAPRRLQALGDVFSALSAAVGAADKVVELMKRPTEIPEVGTLAPAHFAGKITLQVWGREGGRCVCVIPKSRHETMPAPFCSTHAHAAALPLQDVTFHYPARPTLRVLNGINITVNPGEIVALVSMRRARPPG